MKWQAFGLAIFNLRLLDVIKVTRFSSETWGNLYSH